MKKTFFALSFSYIIWEIICLAILGLGFFCLITEILDENLSFADIFTFEFLAIIAVIVIFVVVLICLILFRAIFYDKEIVVLGEIIGGKNRIQFSEQISYNEIAYINLLKSLNNCKNKTMRREVMQVTVPEKLYLEFVLKSGTIKRLWIDPFSKKQRQKMLDIINEKIGSNYNYNILWEECQKEIKLKKEQKRKKKTK